MVDDDESGGFYCDTCWASVYGTPPEIGGECVTPKVPPTSKATDCHQCHTTTTCYQDANEAYDADGDGKLDEHEKGGYYCEPCWAEVYGSPPEKGAQPGGKLVVRLEPASGGKGKVSIQAWGSHSSKSKRKHKKKKHIPQHDPPTMRTVFMSMPTPTAIRHGHEHAAHTLIKPRARPSAKHGVCHQCHVPTVCYQDETEAFDWDGDGHLEEHEKGGFYCEPCWTGVYGAPPERAPPRWKKRSCNECHKATICYQDANEAHDADGDGKFEEHEKGGFYCEPCWTGVYGAAPIKEPPRWKETACHGCQKPHVCFEDSSEAIDLDGNGEVDAHEMGGFYCDKCWMESYGQKPARGGDWAENRGRPGSGSAVSLLALHDSAGGHVVEGTLILHRRRRKGSPHLRAQAGAGAVAAARGGRIPLAPNRRPGGAGGPSGPGQGRGVTEGRGGKGGRRPVKKMGSIGEMEGSLGDSLSALTLANSPYAQKPGPQKGRRLRRGGTHSASAPHIPTFKSVFRRAGAMQIARVGGIVKAGLGPLTDDEFNVVADKLDHIRDIAAGHDGDVGGDVDGDVDAKGTIGDMEGAGEVKEQPSLELGSLSVLRPASPAVPRQPASFQTAKARGSPAIDEMVTVRAIENVPPPPVTRSGAFDSDFEQVGESQRMQNAAMHANEFKVPEGKHSRHGRRDGSPPATTSRGQSRGASRGQSRRRPRSADAAGAKGTTGASGAGAGKGARKSASREWEKHALRSPIFQAHPLSRMLPAPSTGPVMDGGAMMRNLRAAGEEAGGALLGGEPGGSSSWEEGQEIAIPKCETGTCGQCRAFATCYQDASEAFDADGDGTLDDTEKGGFYCETCWVKQYGSQPLKTAPPTSPQSMHHLRRRPSDFSEDFPPQHGGGGGGGGGRGRDGDGMAHTWGGPQRRDGREEGDGREWSTVGALLQEGGPSKMGEERLEDDRWNEAEWETQQHHAQRLGQAAAIEGNLEQKWVHAEESLIQRNVDSFPYPFLKAQGLLEYSNDRAYHTIDSMMERRALRWKSDAFQLGKEFVIEHRKRDQERAAPHIQKLVRGHLKRCLKNRRRLEHQVELEEARQAVLMTLRVHGRAGLNIQRVWRASHYGRVPAREMAREEKAARYIQCRWRIKKAGGILAVLREQFRLQNIGANELQRAFRGFHGRKTAKFQRRRFNITRREDKLRDRDYCVKEYFMQLGSSSQIVQWWRAINYNMVKFIGHDVARTIQRAWGMRQGQGWDWFWSYRGRCVMYRLRNDKYRRDHREEVLASAVKIQAVFRSFYYQRWARLLVAERGETARRRLNAKALRLADKKVPVIPVNLTVAFPKHIRSRALPFEIKGKRLPMYIHLHPRLAAAGRQLLAYKAAAKAMLIKRMYEITPGMGRRKVGRSRRASVAAMDKYETTLSEAMEAKKARVDEVARRASKGDSPHHDAEAGPDKFAVRVAGRYITPSLRLPAAVAGKRIDLTPKINVTRLRQWRFKAIRICCEHPDCPLRVKQWYHRRRHEAALDIQARWRSYLGFLVLKGKVRHQAWLKRHRKPLAAIEIQRVVRGNKGRARALRAHAHRAARKIQSTFRSFFVRRMVGDAAHYKASLAAARRLQRLWKGRKMRQLFRMQVESQLRIIRAARSFQRSWRGYVQRRAYERLLEARRVRAELGNAGRELFDNAKWCELDRMLLRALGASTKKVRKLEDVELVGKAMERAEDQPFKDRMRPAAVVLELMSIYDKYCKMNPPEKKLGLTKWNKILVACHNVIGKGSGASMTAVEGEIIFKRACAANPTKDEKGASHIDTRLTYEGFCQALTMAAEKKFGLKRTGRRGSTTAKTTAEEHNLHHSAATWRGHYTGTDAMVLRLLNDHVFMGTRISDPMSKLRRQVENRADLRCSLSQQVIRHAWTAFFFRRHMRNLKLKRKRLRREHAMFFGAMRLQMCYRTRRARAALREKLRTMYQKYFDAESGMPYWLNPLTQESTWSKPAILGDMEVECVIRLPDEGAEFTKACVQCGMRTASRSCVECEDVYCKQCHIEQHSKGKRKEHSHCEIDLCVECEFQVAAKRCDKCLDAYCDTCFKDRHSTGKLKEHTWVPLVDTCGACDVQDVAPGPNAGRFFCDDCRIPYCKECYDTYHDPHTAPDMAGHNSYALPFETLPMRTHKTEVWARHQQEEDEARTRAEAQAARAKVEFDAAAKLQATFRMHRTYGHYFPLRHNLRVVRLLDKMLNEQDAEIRARKLYRVQNVLGLAPVLETDSEAEAAKKRKNLARWHAVSVDGAKGAFQRLKEGKVARAARREKAEEERVAAEERSAAAGESGEEGEGGEGGKKKGKGGWRSKLKDRLGKGDDSDGEERDDSAGTKKHKMAYHKTLGKITGGIGKTFRKMADKANPDKGFGAWLERVADRLEDTAERHLDAVEDLADELQDAVKEEEAKRQEEVDKMKAGQKEQRKAELNMLGYDAFLDDDGLDYYIERKTGKKGYENPLDDIEKLRELRVLEAERDKNKAAGGGGAGGGAGGADAGGLALYESPSAYMAPEAAGGGAAAGQWAEFYDDANACPYWYNEVSGESVYEDPFAAAAEYGAGGGGGGSGGGAAAGGGAWTEYYDDENACPYWYNEASGESVYEDPNGGW